MWESKVKSGTGFEAILQISFTPWNWHNLEFYRWYVSVAHPWIIGNPHAPDIFLSIPLCSVGHQRTTLFAHVCTLCFRNRFAIEGAEEVWRHSVTPELTRKTNGWRLEMFFIEWDTHPERWTVHLECHLWLFCSKPRCEICDLGQSFWLILFPIGNVVRPPRLVKENTISSTLVDLCKQVQPPIVGLLSPHVANIGEKFRSQKEKWPIRLIGGAGIGEWVDGDQTLWEILPTLRDSLLQGKHWPWKTMAGHSYTRSSRDLPTKMKFMWDSGAVIGAIYTYYYWFI